MFWNPVSKAKYSYILIPEGVGQTRLQMKEVLMVDIQFMEITEKISYQRGVKELEALMIVEEDIDELIKEIKRRD